jgi:hypothetical protein
MKGVIFNLLEEAVTAEHGERAWPDLIDASGVGGVYTSLGSYPDEDVFALVDTTAAVLGLTPADVLRWFGRRAIPLLATRYPQMFANHTSARNFLGSVNAIIHPEVRKLYSGARCPHFHFSDRDDGALIMGYHSPRRLCMLAEGLVVGASDHFGETVAIDHLSCMMDGQPLCRLAARWSQ